MIDISSPRRTAKLTPSRARTVWSPIAYVLVSPSTRMIVSAAGGARPRRPPGVARAAAGPWPGGVGAWCRRQSRSCERLAQRASTITVCGPGARRGAAGAAEAAAGTRASVLAAVVTGMHHPVAGLQPVHDLGHLVVGQPGLHLAGAGLAVGVQHLTVRVRPCVRRARLGTATTSSLLSVTIWAVAVMPGRMPWAPGRVDLDLHRVVDHALGDGPVGAITPRCRGCAARAGRRR